MSMNLLAIGAGQAYSWFKAGGAGVWYPEVGSLLNNSCDGGILEALERETGKTYPHLTAMRQECVDRWRDFQRAMPWSKEGTLQTYNNTVNSFAEAVQAQEKVGFGGLAGITETIKKPIVIIILVVLLVVFMLLLFLKKR